MCVCVCVCVLSAFSESCGRIDLGQPNFNCRNSTASQHHIYMSVQELPSFASFETRPIIGQPTTASATA